MCRLPRYACQFIEMCLMVTADHGPAVSGAHNTIVCARAGKDLISSLTSGLLTIVRHPHLSLINLLDLYSYKTHPPKCNLCLSSCNFFIFFFRVTVLEALWMLQQSSSAKHLIAACCPWNLWTRWRRMASWSWALDTESSQWVPWLLHVWASDTASCYSG